MARTEQDDLKREEFFRDWLLTSPGKSCRRFVVTVLAEKPGIRRLVTKPLCETVFLHHNDPEVFRRKLERLGYPGAARELDRRPKPLRTRLGNFGEIIASEVLRQIKGYEVPVYRLRYNMNDDSSPKGDDVLAFEFEDEARGTEASVIVTEVKVRKHYQSDAVVEAHEALLSGHRPRPKSFQFVVDVLYREGKSDLAQKILDLSNKFRARAYRKQSCLFLVTANEPRDAFGCIEGAKRVAPQLEAFQLAIDDLHELVESVFEAEVDANAL